VSTTLVDVGAVATSVVVVDIVVTANVVVVSKVCFSQS
jgi:hypothetical protein